MSTQVIDNLALSEFKSSVELSFVPPRFVERKAINELVPNPSSVLVPRHPLL